MIAGASQRARYNRCCESQHWSWYFSSQQATFFVAAHCPERQVRRINCSAFSKANCSTRSLAATATAQRLFWRSKPPTCCTEVSPQQPFPLGTSPVPIFSLCSCARVYADKSRVRPPPRSSVARKKEVSPMELNATSRPCLALLTEEVLLN